LPARPHCDIDGPQIWGTPMTLWKTWAVIAAVMLTCGAARAQDVAVGAPDPAKLALAEQIVAASGGKTQIETMLRSMFGVVQKSMAANSTSYARDFIGPMFEDITQEVVALTPQLLELSARAYAQAFTEHELRDWLAFQTSETGRAMIARLPAIQAKVVSQTMPLIMTAMPAILRKSVDRICRERQCTSEQRAALEKAMAKMSRASAS
jgi:hypothetical protein